MVGMNQIMERLKERLVSGITFSIAAYGNKYVSERLARRYLKEWSEITVGLGTALAYDGLLKDKVKGYDKYLDKLVDGVSDYGFWETAKIKALKEPIAFFTDANTIMAINFDIDTIDPRYIKVYVDDNEVSVSSTSGELGKFTIQLANAIQAGWHKVIVQAGNTKKDTFRGKLYVPG